MVVMVEMGWGCARTLKGGWLREVMCYPLGQWSSREQTHQAITFQTPVKLHPAASYWPNQVTWPRPASLAVRFFIFYFLLFRATCVAYGRSQARGQIGAAAGGLQPQQCGIQATSVIYTTAHGNAGSLTH